jgi:hypothetical protein
VEVVEQLGSPLNSRIVDYDEMHLEFATLRAFQVGHAGCLKDKARISLGFQRGDQRDTITCDLFSVGLAIWMQKIEDKCAGGAVA